METQGELRITVAIDRREEPIAGWLEWEPDRRRSFSGMLELIGLLDGLRTGSAREGGCDR